MIKSIWNYVKPTFEGDDGKLSYRRITAFFTFALICRIVLQGVENEHQYNTLVALMAFFLLLSAIVTFDQITRFKNGKSD